jgi:AraC family transcriptional regulator
MPQLPSRSFERFDDFYRETYGSAVREVRHAGRLGAVMILAEQAAGDWSDAATPNLLIGTPVKLHAPARMDMGGGRFSISGPRPDAFVVSPPDFATTVIVDGPHIVRVLALPYQGLLDFAGDEAGLPVDGDLGRLHQGCQVNADISRLLDQLWDEGEKGNPRGSLWADGAILQLAALLLQLRDGAAPASKGGLAAWQLNRSIEIICSSYAEDIQLQDLSNAVGLSPAHFGRAFRHSTGKSPLQWLVEHRISRAKALLVDREKSLTEIAQSVGFQGQSAFGAAFKRLTGSTPGEFRRSMEN